MSKTFEELVALPPLTVEDDRVIMTGGEGLAESVIHDMLGYPDDEGLEAAEKQFKELFDIVPGFHLANPKEDFYQGVDRMSVIRRKADGALFGFTWWTPIAKYAEPYIEGNGDEYGYELDYKSVVLDWDALPAVFVWTPVEPYTITSYKHKENN